MALNAAIIIVDSLPDRSVVGQKFLNSVQRYQTFVGLDQAWSMFAPIPGGVNSYVDAQITFKDGSKEKWTFPRPSQIKDIDKFLAGERYRKYAQENLIPMERSEVWFDLSYYVAREVARIEESGRRRVLEDIQFYKHTSLVKSPDKVFIPHGQLSKDYETQAVFNYRPEQKVKNEVSVSH
ncbi:hypothetical protein D3C72_1249670 [compost metagenome]